MKGLPVSAGGVGGVGGAGGGGGGYGASGRMFLCALLVDTVPSATSNIGDLGQV